MKNAIFIILLTATFSNAEVKLPKYIIPCKAKDSLCLKNVAKGLVARLKQGIPEFNLPSIDPVFLPDYNQTDLSSPEMPYTGLVKNIEYKGASNFEISKFDVDLNELTFNLIISFPKLVMKGYEIVRIKGLGFDVDGEGIVTEYYDNVTISLSLNGTKYSGQEKEHINWSISLISVSLGAGRAEVDSSFTDAKDYQAVIDKTTTIDAHLGNPIIELYVKNTIGAFIFRTISVVHDIFPIDVLYLPDISI